MNGPLSLHAVGGCSQSGALGAVFGGHILGFQCFPFCRCAAVSSMLPVLSQDSVSSLGRKQERILTVRLWPQSLEGREGEEEDLTSREMNKWQKELEAAKFAWVELYLSAEGCDSPMLGLRGQECSWLKGGQSTRTDQSRGFFYLLQNSLHKYSWPKGLKTAQTLPTVTHLQIQGYKPCSLTREPFLEELPVPQMVQSLGSSSREESSMHGQPLEAALGGSCSGRGSSFKFHSPLVPTTQVKSRDGNKRKKAGGLERFSRRLRAGAGHTVGFWGAGNFLIWMEAQRSHFKMIL